MQISSFVLTLLLSTAVAAKGHNGTTSESSQCKQIVKLQSLVDLAANTTKLADKTNNNATKIADIQAKASAASTQLTTLTSNSTLVSDCAVIDAAEQTKDTCAEMKELQKYITMASNSTKVATKTDNNATKIAEVAAKASAAQTKLDTLNSNTTLVDACTAIKTEKEAKKNSESPIYLLCNCESD
jgi:hypothetical protein